MGKRSSFERRKNDAYDTPAAAVAPLLQHLSPRTHFVEPCAGDGQLVDHLQAAGHVMMHAYDISPRADWVNHGDARTARGGFNADCYITNPPWTRVLLHPIIANLSSHLPTWLLFDADWMHTRQAAPYLPLLRKVVSVGRVKWIPDSLHTGKDNCCWYLFDAQSEAPAQFIGRLAA